MLRCPRAVFEARTCQAEPERPAAEERQRTAEREAAILETAAGDAANAALAVLDEHAEAFAAKLTARRTKLCEALLEALGKVGRIEEEQGEILALGAYLEADEVGRGRARRSTASAA
jgi:hypothetical protein